MCCVAFIAACLFDHCDVFVLSIVFFEFQLSKHSSRRVLQLNVSALALVAILLLAGSSAQAAPASRRLLEQTQSARRTLLVSTFC